MLLPGGSASACCRDLNININIINIININNNIINNNNNDDNNNNNDIIIIVSMMMGGGVVPLRGVIPPTFFITINY